MCILFLIKKEPTFLSVIVLFNIANGGAEFVRRTERLLKHAGPSYLAFVGAGIMKPYELYLFLYNLIQVLG